LNNTVKMLHDVDALPKQVVRKLRENTAGGPFVGDGILGAPRASAVLFLLGRRAPGDRHDATGPFLILNKRSSKVRQPGDLCCPGGSITPRLDAWLARLLRLVGSPLTRWPDWPGWRQRWPQAASNLALLLATGLRESFEEMRLNPLGVRFLGILPCTRLVMFRRVIYPMVCWVPRQVRFFTNWEVDEVVAIPLTRLLEPDNYARCVIDISVSNESRCVKEVKEFPCFLHSRGGHTERLWGATFRIAMSFLDLVFDFRPPAIETLQTVTATLDRDYMTGRPGAETGAAPL
jgi:hypothetical protein